MLCDELDQGDEGPHDLVRDQQVQLGAVGGGGHMSVGAWVKKVPSLWRGLGAEQDAAPHLLAVVVEMEGRATRARVIHPNSSNVP